MQHVFQLCCLAEGMYYVLLGLFRVSRMIYFYICMRTLSAPLKNLVICICHALSISISVSIFICLSIGRFTVEARITIPKLHYDDPLDNPFLTEHLALIEGEGSEDEEFSDLDSEGSESVSVSDHHGGDEGVGESHVLVFLNQNSFNFISQPSCAS